tara:strand:+ start:243 stop:398 length:156 start_codon:yes stop_codon:yes gene_type:complete
MQRYDPEQSSRTPTYFRQEIDRIRERVGQSSFTSDDVNRGLSNLDEAFDKL